ncbi:MAG: hypothetical protein LAO31_17600, partial [Acidobacteriia bacterium]|nr:hypothetical protein [Terriglobia bacterium]
LDFPTFPTGLIIRTCQEPARPELNSTPQQTSLTFLFFGLDNGVHLTHRSSSSWMLLQLNLLKLQEAKIFSK